MAVEIKMNVLTLLISINCMLLLLEESHSSAVTCQDIAKPGSTYLSASSRYGLGGDLRIPMPPHAKAGDLLILFLSRTDGALPLELDGWTAGPSCFKEGNKGNHIRECWTAEDCLETKTSTSGIKYCTRFPYNHTGRDLATIVFHKPIQNNSHEANANVIYRFNLPGFNPAWATLAAISGVRMLNSTSIYNPIRSSAVVACDKKAAGVFPSVFGKAGDLLLLSMAHDDPTNMTMFQAPLGTRLVQEQHGMDEAGFLFARHLNVTGKTPVYATKGEGTQWWCKEALLSLVIKMLPSDEDNNTINELLILDENNDPCHDVSSSSMVISLADIFSGLWNFVRWATGTKHWLVSNLVGSQPGS